MRDLRNLDRAVAERILRQIEHELEEDPDKGTALSGKFRGLYKYRIGDYRVIYAKTEECVLVLRIGHRGKVYR